MSGANTAAFWSVKSLWPELSASGMEDDNLLAEVNTRSVIRMERSLRSGRQVEMGGREGATARVSRRLWNGCGLAAPLSFVETGENREQA